MKNDKLSEKFLISNGFKLNDKIDIFENRKMPYYVREGVLLFFNIPVTKFNDDSFLIGYGDMRCGIYYAVDFRWISTRSELIKIYEVITNKKFTELCK
jgi:hypothetical protein